jgi:hypothetical protein
MESGRGSGDRSQLIIRARVARGVQRGRHARPPLRHRGPGTRRRRLRTADVDPAPGGRHSGDAGGDRLAPTPVQHVMYPHGRGAAWGELPAHA